MSLCWGKGASSPTPIAVVEIFKKCDTSDKSCSASYMKSPEALNLLILG